MKNLLIALAVLILPNCHPRAGAEREAREYMTLMHPGAQYTLRCQDQSANNDVACDVSIDGQVFTIACADDGESGCSTHFSIPAPQTHNSTYVHTQPMIMPRGH